MNSNISEVFLIAAITADGFIARNSNEFANWTSPADKKRFVTLTREAKVMIMGSTTFNTFIAPLPGRLHVVYSHFENYEKKWPNHLIETTQLPPRELIESLKKRGFNKIAICGGSSIYSQFLESGLIDKIYLTIEPLMFGDGIKLFNKQLHKSFILQTQSVETVQHGTVFINYNVTYN